MTPKAKRLAPTTETTRELFLKSGNLCAFPGCTRLMMNAEGVFVGQVCHVEAAEDGGERFNRAMSNEDRRAFGNLMLMCYDHHVETNDVARFSVAVLRRYKAEHEARFSSPDRAILATLKDWTTLEEPKPPKNFIRANRVLGFGHGPEELAGTIEILTHYLEKLRRVPVSVRSFMGKVAQRALRVRNTWAVETGGHGLLVACTDLEGAFRMSRSAIGRMARQLELYRLGGADNLETNQEPAIRIANVDGWPFWLDMATFCSTEDIPIERLTELLDLTALDD